VTGDVLGGADGSGSVVRKQLLPEARLEDTGMAGIGGKLAMATQVTRRDGGVWTNSSMPGSSTWSQYWRDANGWPGAFPSPTYSWPMCWGLWIGLAGWRDIPACRNYGARATARPSFVKAHADQMAHFVAAD
jgi:hypothetical protein